MNEKGEENKSIHTFTRSIMLIIYKFIYILS